MPKENPSQSCFTFTEREKLYDQLTRNRFMALVMQPDVDIHEVGESTNSFGEFFFVTVSCRIEQPKQAMTFWGLGYHEHRERWIAESWQWYESQRLTASLPVLEKDEVYALLKDRETFVHAQANPQAPSRRAQMYELLAELSDEDGALSELDDLGWAFLADDDEALD